MAASSIFVAGSPVEAFQDDLWRKVRVRDGVPSNFLEHPSVVGEFKPGGGKGGDLMAFTTCGRYIIKEIKGDHQSLLTVAHSYCERILQGNTLLCKVYLHYRDPSSDKTYMVMGNILSHKGPWVGLYDLKGCADDKTLISNGRKIKVVNKRIWNVHLWCGQCAWTDDRVVYYQGKVAARGLSVTLTDEQRASVIERLKLDTAWLSGNNLMDYSLLVAMCRVRIEDLDQDAAACWARRAPPSELRFPLIHRQGKKDVMLVYIGIIDFLQQWTGAKQIAMCLKFAERNKATIPPAPYAQRFLDHFSGKMSGGAVPLEPAEETDDSEGPLAVRFYSCSSFQDFEHPKNGIESSAVEILDNKALAETQVEVKRRSQDALCMGCFAGLLRR
mmetsp:Transcript_67388/g.171026  ORF Transcript_67388/g.171026 Transcript_67388/m.171026 type:complete len:386 (-) Transcript_67388:113-1270(-)